MKCKRHIIILLIFISILFQISGQIITNPNSRLYKYLSVWHKMGYIEKMPVIRPYSLQKITEMLKNVKKRGNSESAVMADRFLADLTTRNFIIDETIQFPGPIHIEVESRNFFDTEGDIYVKFGPKLTSTGFLSDFCSYSGEMSMQLFHIEGEDSFPAWQAVRDESETGGGSLTLGGIDFGAGQLGLTGLFLGKDNLFFQVGIMRSAFGPFFDGSGPVLSSDAPAAGHFSLFYQGDWFSFSSILLDLYALNRVNSSTGVKEGLPSPEEKYLIIHNARFYPTRWFNFGIIQTNMTGGRFHPGYLIPLQLAFYTQQLYGDSDSTFLGLFTQLDFPFNISWDTVFYVDDWNSFSPDSVDKPGNSISFDSAQNKFALKTGLSWTPWLSLLKQIKFSYIMVTPYMYTHKAAHKVGFLTYTHNGINMGSYLEPNSDQISLDFLLMPIPEVDINLWFKFTRHGNASEGFEEPGILSDGTIFDDGFESDGTVTFYGPGRFLTQSVIESVLQLGFDTQVYLPISIFQLYLKGGYQFQYIRNKDLQVGDDGTAHYLTLEASFKL